MFGSLVFAKVPRVRVSLVALVTSKDFVVLVAFKEPSCGKFPITACFQAGVI